MVLQHWGIQYETFYEAHWADGWMAAINKILPKYPELGNSKAFQYDVDYTNRRVKITRKIGGPNKVASLQEAQIIKQVDQMDTAPYNLATGYTATLGVHAEMILDDAIRVKRIEQLRDLIDETLAKPNRKNKKLFQEYTTELIQLQKEGELS